MGEVNKQRVFNELSTVLLNIHTREESWRQAQLLMAPQLAPDFSPFDVYGSREVDVSRHLGLLLDPHGTHGQGALFWDAFCEKVVELLQQQKQDSLPAEEVESKAGNWLRKTQVQGAVELEHMTESGRYIDLVIRAEKGSSAGVVAIENKPWLWSKDESKQLEDYASYLDSKTNVQDWVLVYLSHEPPTEHSIHHDELQRLVKNGLFVHVRWTDLLSVLGECLSKVQSAKVRWFVEDFIKIMEKRMGNIDDGKMSYLSSSFNQNASSLANAFLLRDTLRQWQSKQLATLESTLRQRCLEEDIPFSWHINSNFRNKKGFTLGFEGDMKVGFEVAWNFTLNDEGSIYWGLYMPGNSQDKCKEINRVLRDLNPTWPNPKSVDAEWPYWVYLDDDPLFFSDNKEVKPSLEHPWLSVDYRDERNIVDLIMVRYREALRALKHEELAEYVTGATV